MPTSPSASRQLTVLTVLAVLALLAPLAATAGGTAVAAEGGSPAPSDPPPPLSIAELEQAVALQLSQARQNPIGMADDLAAAQHDGWYAAILPNGVPFSARANYLAKSEEEARAQPVLDGLRWSEELARAAREWAPRYARGAGGHGSGSLSFGARVNRARQRLGGQLGQSIEAIATQRMYGRSFVYTWWLSNGEWPINSATNPLDPGGAVNRGHRGIVNDVRMDTVGVGCAVVPQRVIRGQTTANPPGAACVAITANGVGDAAPTALGAPAVAPLDQLDGATGSSGATTGEDGSTITIDPSAPPAAPSTGLDSEESATGGSLVVADEDGNVQEQGGATDTAVADSQEPTIEGVPAAVFNAACDGFAAYLRQEVGSRQADRTDEPGCVVDSPDLQQAQLSMAPRTGGNAGDACEDVAQGRTDDPVSAVATIMRSQSTSGALTAVTSSGSTEESFPFLYSSETGPDGRSVASQALACDDDYVYRGLLRRDLTVNPLLTVNATAEAMRRAGDV